MDKQVLLCAVEKKKNKGKGIGSAWRGLQFEMSMLLAGLPEMMTFQ